MVYSVESARALVSRADASDNLSNATDESVQVPYRVVTRGLADAGVPYDVVLFPDGVTAPDRVVRELAEPLRTVVLPDCYHLTDQQAAALHGYLDGGGCAIVIGGSATISSQWCADRCRRIRAFGALSSTTWLP